MDFLQSEWIVKRRNYAATLNNRGSRTTLYIIDVEGYCFYSVLVDFPTLTSLESFLKGFYLSDNKHLKEQSKFSKTGRQLTDIYVLFDF
jgi:hypothetical protein